jgi:hypothetical protein
MLLKAASHAGRRDAEALAGKAGLDPVRAPQGISVRKFSPCIPRAIVVGASTGGPQALGILLEGLAPHLSTLPVFVVLHMPADFTTLVTAHIERATGLETSAAKHGEPVKPGHVYFAPGHVHTRVLRIGETPLLVPTRCFVPPRRATARARSASCSPEWEPTASPARARSSRRAGRSSPRTRPRASSGACRVPSPGRASPPRCSRSSGSPPPSAP